MIRRNPDLASNERHDLAVIGGGIHGAQLALAASRHGLRVLLLEAEDFGSGASGNSLRIVHGGLRYLQTADLPRFRESVAERRWHAREFPDLVEPLPCLMPLYRQGLKRRSVMRVALTLNDMLSSNRNDRLEQRVTLPGSMTLGPEETVARFAQVRRTGLEGAALWYDYSMRSSERILIETLHRACDSGAQVLNYARFVAVRAEGGRVSGLVAEDRLSGQRLEIRADRICNCTGSAARVLAAGIDREFPELFVPSLAFNVLFEGERLGPCGLAIAAPEAGSPVYFLCPSPVGIWAGTEHVGRPDDCQDSTVQEHELSAFMGRINRAIPSLGLTPRQVRRVCSGLLPVSRAQSVTLTGREVIIDHGRRGGLNGLYSATGIKFTTARKVAAKALATMVGETPGSGAVSGGAPVSAVSVVTASLTDAAQFERLDEPSAVALVRSVAATEAVFSADDFCLRRTNWLFTAPDFGRLQRFVARALGAGAPRADAVRPFPAVQAGA